MAVRTAYLVLTRLRSLAAIRPRRASLLLGALLLLISMLICWPSNGHISWAKERANPPAVKFHADPLVAQVKQESQPSKEMTVTNADAQDGSLEFTAEIQNGEGLLGTADSSSLTFLDEPLTLRFSQQDLRDKVTEDVYLYVRNSSDLKAELAFSTKLRDAKNHMQQVKFKHLGSTSADPHSVTPIHLQMKSGQFKDLSLPLEGFLVVSGGSQVPAPATLPITISETRPAWLSKTYGPLDTRIWTLVVPFVLGVVSVGATYLAFRLYEPKGKEYCPLMKTTRGNLNALGTGLAFDPSKSWATLLTGVAALVTAFTGATILPDTRVTFTKNDVAVLALSFGSILVFSPMIYNIVRGRKPDKPEELHDGEANPRQTQVSAPGKEPEPPGYVLTLLMTSAGILWALLGQLFLAIVIVNEIANADVTDVNRWLLRVLLGLTMLVAVAYVSGGVWSVLRREVRWGESLQRQKDKLNDLKGKLHNVEGEILDEDKQLEAMRKQSIRIEITNITKRIAEIDKQLRFGTSPHEMTLL